MLWSGNIRRCNQAIGPRPHLSTRPSYTMSFYSTPSKQKAFLTLGPHLPLNKYPSPTFSDISPISNRVADAAARLSHSTCPRPILSETRDSCVTTTSRSLTRGTSRSSWLSSVSPLSSAGSRYPDYSLMKSNSISPVC